MNVFSVTVCISVNKSKESDWCDGFFLYINLPSENSQFIHKYHFFGRVSLYRIKNKSECILVSEIDWFIIFWQVWMMRWRSAYLKCFISVSLMEFHFLYLNRTTTIPTYTNPLTSISVPLQHITYNTDNNNRSIHPHLMFVRMIWI